MDLGVLEKITDLREACERKYAANIEGQVQQLDICCVEMQNGLKLLQYCYPFVCSWDRF